MSASIRKTVAPIDIPSLLETVARHPLSAKNQGTGEDDQQQVSSEEILCVYHALKNAGLGAGLKLVWCVPCDDRHDYSMLGAIGLGGALWGSNGPTTVEALQKEGVGGVYAIIGVTHAPCFEGKRAVEEAGGVDIATMAWVEGCVASELSRRAARQLDKATPKASPGRARRGL